jgi:hypothetical protein
VVFVKRIILFVLLAAVLFAAECEDGTSGTRKMSDGTSGQESKSIQQNSDGGYIAAVSSSSVDMSGVSKKSTSGMIDVYFIENRRKLRISIIYYI